MTKDLANLDETLRALDDIRADIKKQRRYINFVPDDAFEVDAHDAFSNSLSRLLMIELALVKKKKSLENS